VINEGLGHQLVIHGLDGSSRVIRRTGSKIVMSEVRWSPDGRWISYVRDDGCCSTTIHLVHPDGSGAHTVAVMEDPRHDSPSAALWAPDGQLFAYTTQASDFRDHTLTLLDAGSGKITVSPVPNAYPFACSKEGTELAVVQGGFEGGVNGQPNSVLMIDASGQGHPLATVKQPSVRAGAWSPDGTKLVISGVIFHGIEIRAADLELIDAANGPPRVLTDLPPQTQVEILAWRPHVQG
jgi:Tol biopolymer transport system component